MTWHYAPTVSWNPALRPPGLLCRWFGHKWHHNGGVLERHYRARGDYDVQHCRWCSAKLSRRLTRYPGDNTEVTGC